MQRTSGNHAVAGLLGRLVTRPARSPTIAPDAPIQRAWVDAGDKIEKWDSVEGGTFWWRFLFMRTFYFIRSNTAPGKFAAKLEPHKDDPKLRVMQAENMGWKKRRAWVARGLRPPTKESSSHLTADEVKHLTDAQVQTYYEKCGNAWVAGAAKNKSVKGKLNVLEEPAYEAEAIEFLADSKLKGEDAETAALLLNAFTETNENKPQQAFLSKRRGGTDTAIHEGMHVMEYAPFESQYGRDLHEGIAEYFTLIVLQTTPGPLPRTARDYADFERQVRTLIGWLGTAGEQAVASLFFYGEPNAITEAMKKKGRDMATWRGLTVTGNLSGAQAYLETGKP